MKKPKLQLSPEAYDELERELQQSCPVAPTNGHITMGNVEIHRRTLAEICLHQIIDLVCETFPDLGVTRRDVLGPLRDTPTITCRHTAMALIRQTRQLSSIQVGRFFKRDHGTVLHAEAQVRNRCDTEPKYAAMYNELLTKLTAK